MNAQPSDRITWKCPSCGRSYLVPADRTASGQCRACERVTGGNGAAPQAEPGRLSNPWKPVALVCLGMLLAVAAQFVVSELRTSAGDPAPVVASTPPADAGPEEPARPEPIIPEPADAEVPVAEEFPEFPPMPEEDAWPEWNPAEFDRPKDPARPAAPVAQPVAPDLQVLPVVIQPGEFPQGPDPLASRIEALRAEGAQLQSEIQALTADRQQVFNEARSVYASGTRISREAAAIRSQLLSLAVSIQQYELIMLNGQIIRDERILALKQLELANMRRQQSALQSRLTPVEVEAERLQTRYAALDAQARSLLAKIRQKSAALSSVLERLSQAEAAMQGQN